MGRSTFDLKALLNTPYEYQFQALGNVYHMWYQLEDLAAGTTIELEMRQDGNNLIHILNTQLRSNASKISMKIYSNASFTAGTVPMNYSCNNHIIDKTPSLVGYQDPTAVDVTSPAVLRDETEIYGASQGGQNTASADPDGLLIERLWKPEDYIITITNEDGAARDLFFEMVWYETEQ